MRNNKICLGWQLGFIKKLWTGIRYLYARSGSTVVATSWFGRRRYTRHETSSRVAGRCSRVARCCVHCVPGHVSGHRRQRSDFRVDTAPKLLKWGLPGR